MPAFSVVDSVALARNQDSLSLSWGVHARSDNVSTGSFRLVDNTSGITIATQTGITSVGNPAAVLLAGESVRSDLFTGIYVLPGSWVANTIHLIVLLARIDVGTGFAPYLEDGLTVIRSLAS